jgi:hypothetical protein
MDQIVKIKIWVPDQQSLKHILSAAKVELDCGSPKRDTDGNFVITLYASPQEADKIAALGYRHESDKHYDKVLEQRQTEVSKVDRFQGGKIKPEGLGTKR